MNDCSFFGGGRVGDLGQRFEVRCRDGRDREIVFGWSGTEDGVKTMVNAINKHPTWNSARVIDRHIKGGDGGPASG